jgi:hypothetical protein
VTKRSKFEAAQREAENTRLKEIEAAWMGSLSKADAEAFARAVAAAHARPPQGPPATQPPGTQPNPPKREPRPKKEERPQRRRY